MATNNTSRIDWDNITQSKEYIDAQFLFPFYQKSSVFAREYTCLTSMLFVPLGLTDGVASLVQSILGTVEAVFKGMCNALWGLTSFDSPTLHRGGLQVIGGLFIGVISILIIVIRVLRLMVGSVLWPIETHQAEFEKYQAKILSYKG